MRLFTCYTNCMIQISILGAREGDCIFQLKFENWYIDFLPDCIAFGLASQGNMFPHFPVHQLLKAEFLSAHFEENPKKSMYLILFMAHKCLTFLAYKFPRSRHTWHGNTLDSLDLLAYRNKQKCAGNEFIIYFAKQQFGSSCPPTPPHIITITH